MRAMGTIIRLELRRLRWLLFLAPAPLAVVALGLVMPEAVAAVLFVVGIAAFLFCTVAAVAVSVARWGADMEDPSFAVLLTMPVSRSWFFTGRLLAGLLLVTWTVVWSWLAILVGAELESAKHLGELSNYMPFLAMLAPETALPTVATFLYGFFALAMFIAALAVPWRSGMVVALVSQVTLGIALAFYLRWTLHQPYLVMNQQVLLLPALLAPAGLIASFVGYRLISIPQGHRAGWVLATWLGVGGLSLAAVPAARTLAVRHVLAPEVTVVATSPNGRYAVVRLDYGACPLLDSPRQEASFSLAQATAYVDCETGRARLLADRELPPPMISGRGGWVVWQDAVGRHALNTVVNGRTGALASFGLPPRIPNPYTDTGFASRLYTLHGWSATERLAAVEYTRPNRRPPRPAGLPAGRPSWWQWGRPRPTDHSWPALAMSFAPSGGARYELRVVDESGRVLFTDTATAPFQANWAEAGEALTFTKNKRQYRWEPGTGVTLARPPAIPSFRPRHGSGGISPDGRWVAGEVSLRPESASSPTMGDPLKGPFDRRFAFMEARTGKITLGPVGSEFAFWSWSPDSRYVVYLERPGVGPVALTYLSPTGATRRVPLPQIRYDGGSLSEHIFISGRRVVGGSWDGNLAHGWHYHEYYPKPQQLSALPGDLRYRWGGTLLVSGGYVFYGQGPYLVREMPGEGKELFDLRRLRSGLTAVGKRG